MTTFEILMFFLGVEIGGWIQYEWFKMKLKEAGFEMGIKKVHEG
jgi:hypothetical protein